LKGFRAVSYISSPFPKFLAAIGSNERTNFGSTGFGVVGPKRAILWLPFQSTFPVNAVSIRWSVSSALSVVSVSRISLTTVFPRLGAGN
jgi:hypothetical protein